MSADNGIYIGVFPIADGGKEYRVIHAGAIENCDDSKSFPQSLIDAYRVRYWKDAPVFDNRDAAWSKAREIYDKIMEDDFCPVVEYGVCEIVYDRPLESMSIEEAERVMEAYWNRERKSMDDDIAANLGMSKDEYERAHQELRNF